MHKKTRSPQKKAKVSFKTGDLVTGKDQSYRRSIYKVLSSTENPEECIVEFQSLGNQVVDAFKNDGRPKSFYVFLRRYEEFRLATKQEIAASDRVRARYRLMYMLKKLSVFDIEDFGFNKI